VLVDMLQLTLKLDGDMPAVNFTNNKQSLSELFNYSEAPKLDLTYNGDICNIGKYFSL
jgi:hypothetical protein